MTSNGSKAHYLSTRPYCNGLPMQHLFCSILLLHETMPQARSPSLGNRVTKTLWFPKSAYDHVRCLPKASRDSSIGKAFSGVDRLEPAKAIPKDACVRDEHELMMQAKNTKQHRRIVGASPVTRIGPQRRSFDQKPCTRRSHDSQDEPIYRRQRREARPWPSSSQTGCESTLPQPSSCGPINSRHGPDQLNSCQGVTGQTTHPFPIEKVGRPRWMIPFGILGLLRVALIGGQPRASFPKTKQFLY